MYVYWPICKLTKLRDVHFLLTTMWFVVKNLWSQYLNSHSPHLPNIKTSIKFYENCKLSFVRDISLKLSGYIFLAISRSSSNHVVYTTWTARWLHKQKFSILALPLLRFTRSQVISLKVMLCYFCLQ